MIPKLSLALLLTLQLGSVDGLAGPLEPPKGIRHYEIGAAPGCSVTDIDGEPFELTSSQGQWVFLHFWASWCGPCRKEMPSIQQLADTFDGDDLRILLINTAEDEDTIFSFLAEIGMEFSSLMDRDGLVTEKFNPRGLPTTILIDREGKVQYQAIGGREWHKPVYTDFLRQLITDH
jgi:thiol-disulfide isomerase/thioredoxin